MQIAENAKECYNVDYGTLSFTSKQFKVIRILLRLLSLWRPRSAYRMERYVYPVLVNLLLLVCGPIRNSIQASMQPTWLSIQLLYVVNEVAIWLGHIFGNVYFASRDLEKNVLKPKQPLPGITKPLHRMLKILNIAVVITMTFFSILFCTLFIVTNILWEHGAQRFSAQFPGLHGPGDHIFYTLVVIKIIYNLGVGLALTWTLALMYICYAVRLKVMENIFLEWKQSSVKAVSFFIELYAQPIAKSWKHLSKWFLVHNIVVIAIPLYGYALAQAVTGREYHSKHLSQFICYLIYTLIIWLSPIILGEFIKRREKKFMDRVNDISPLFLDAETGLHQLSDERKSDLPSGNDDTSSQASSSTVSETNPPYPEHTFASRSEELRDFQRFLERRTLGLVSGGYSLQLNVSLISLILATLSFLTELRDKNSVDTMYRNCNCTM